MPAFGVKPGPLAVAVHFQKEIALGTQQKVQPAKVQAHIFHECEYCRSKVIGKPVRPPILPLPVGGQLAPVRNPVDECPSIELKSKKAIEYKSDGDVLVGRYIALDHPGTARRKRAVVDFGGKKQLPGLFIAHGFHCEAFGDRFVFSMENGAGAQAELVLRHLETTPGELELYEFAGVQFGEGFHQDNFAVQPAKVYQFAHCVKHLPVVISVLVRTGRRTVCFSTPGLAP